MICLCIKVWKPHFSREGLYPLRLLMGMTGSSLHIACLACETMWCQWVLVGRLSSSDHEWVQWGYTTWFSHLNFCSQIAIYYLINRTYFRESKTRTKLSTRDKLCQMSWTNGLCVTYFDLWLHVWYLNPCLNPQLLALTLSLSKSQQIKW